MYFCPRRIEVTCTCLPERTCKQCLREGLLHSMFILFQQCSTINIYKYKGKYVLKEFLMLLMDRNFNPFSTCISVNKQGHIINGNIPVALRCVTFFSHTSEPTSVLFSYKRASNYITDNQYFSLLMFWQIRYVHWRQYSPSQYFSLQIS